MRVYNGERLRLTSSTIHSASVRQRLPSTLPLKVLETDLPVVSFSMVAVPAVSEVAVTVMRMTSPSETVREKS